MGAIAVAAIAGGVALSVTGNDEGDATSENTAPRQVDPADETLVPVSDPEGEFELSLPEGWVGSTVRGDVDGIGARTFPDDETKAEAFEAAVAALPRAIIYVAFDSDDLGGATFVTNVNLLHSPEPRDLGNDDIAAEAERGIEAIGGEPRGWEEVALPAGRAVRLEYDFEAIGGAGIQYYLLVDGQMWTLTLTSDDIESYERDFDSVAASFAVPG